MNTSLTFCWRILPLSSLIFILFFVYLNDRQVYRFQRWTNQFVCLKPLLAVLTTTAAFVIQHYAEDTPATAGAALATGLEEQHIFERLLVQATVHLAPAMEIISLVSALVATVAVMGMVAAFATELQTHRTVRLFLFRSKRSIKKHKNEKSTLCCA